MTILSTESPSFTQHLSPIKPINPDLLCSPPCNDSTPQSPPVGRKRKGEYVFSPIEPIALVSDDESSPARATFNVKTWRAKSSEDKLKERYTRRSYLYSLVHEKFLIEYDNGRKPICNQKCCFDCQSKFLHRVGDLEKEMNRWWGANVDNPTRSVMLGEELMKYCEWDENGKRTQHYRISGVEVCKNFYLRCRGIHQSTCEKVERDIFCADTSLLSLSSDRRTFKEVKAEKKNELTAWLEIYANDVGGNMPHEDCTVLPYRNITPIFEEYEKDMQMDNEHPVHKSYFFKCFNSLANKLKIKLARDTGTFARCAVCNAYDARLRAAKTPMERAQLKRFRASHHNKQTVQRLKYYKHRRKARKNPSRYLSIIIDGMDQKKTNCPAMGKFTKDDPPLVQRVMGVKVHGIGSYAFIVDDTVRKGANLVCEILRLVLNDLNSQQKLPHDEPVLYLQVDNCGENKNKTLLAFLTDLVRRKIFRKIKAGFLMVGHTHDDIDQIFSTIATHILQAHILCPDQQSLFTHIRNAFSQEVDAPTIKELFADSIFNYDKFYEDVIDPHLAYYQDPHQFRIKLFHEGTPQEIALLHYKNWAHSTHWLPFCKPRSPEEAPVRFDVTPNKKSRTGRKLARGVPTLGQQIDKAVSRAVEGSMDGHRYIEDVPENEAYTSDFEARVFEQTTTAELRGIQWISSSPNVENAPLLQFDIQQIESNIKKVNKIHSDIVLKFAPKYRNVFDSSVLLNWTAWRDRELLRWQNILECLEADNQYTRSGWMTLPDSYIIRQSSTDQTETILSVMEDSAPADFPEEIEQVCYDSGKYGSFTAEQRLDTIRHIVADEELFLNSTQPVFTGQGCIFKFEYPDLQNKTDRTQIGLGIIVAVHGDPASSTATFDIRFCPRKGAKPQTSKTPDTLYANIDADMAFNLKYTVKKKRGGRQPDISTNQPRDVLLAFNLVLTSQGTISKRRINDSKYNLSSYQLADAVILKYYRNLQEK